MTQLASGMIAFASAALAVNLHAETGISSSYEHMDEWSTAAPSLVLSRGVQRQSTEAGPAGTWHIAGPFDEDVICDWDRRIGHERSLSCDFKGIELEGTLEYGNNKWRTSRVTGTRQEHATQTLTLTVGMVCKFDGDGDLTEESEFGPYHYCAFYIDGTDLDGNSQQDKLVFDSRYGWSSERDNWGDDMSQFFPDADEFEDDQETNETDETEEFNEEFNEEFDDEQEQEHDDEIEVNPFIDERQVLNLEAALKEAYEAAVGADSQAATDILNALQLAQSEVSDEGTSRNALWKGFHANSLEEMGKMTPDLQVNKWT